MTSDIEEVEQLNTRDLLLLSQLLEQECTSELDYEELVLDTDKIDDIYTQFTEHSVYKLSHNGLNGNNGITKKELRQIITNTLSSRTILDNCEYYYQKRIDELHNQISALTDQFNTEKKAEA